MSNLYWPAYKERLKNDIDVLIWPTSSKMTGIIFIFDTGQQHFPSKHAGLSHFVEHLMFQGSPFIGSIDYEKVADKIEKIHEILNKIENTSEIKEILKIRHKAHLLENEISELLTTNDFINLLNSMGAYYVNASTFAETVMYEIILWHKSNLLEVLNLYYNQFTNPIFYSFVNEQNIILHEMTMHDDPIFQRIYFETLKNSYLESPVIGYKSTLLSITPKIAKSYVETYYQPRNLTILLMGNTDYEDIEKVRYVFEKLENTYTYYYPTHTPVSPLPAERQYVFHHHKKQKAVSGLKRLNNAKEKAIALLINHYMDKNSVIYNEKVIDFITLLFNDYFMYMAIINPDIKHEEAENSFIQFMTKENYQNMKLSYNNSVSKGLKNTAEMFDFLTSTYACLGTKVIHSIKNIHNIIQDLSYEDFFNFALDWLSKSNASYFTFTTKRGLVKTELPQNDIDIPIELKHLADTSEKVSPKVSALISAYEKKQPQEKINKNLYSTKLYQEYGKHIHILSKKYYDWLNPEFFGVMIFEKHAIDIYEENIAVELLKLAAKSNNYSTLFDILNSYDYTVIYGYNYNASRLIQDFINFFENVDSMINENVIEHIHKLITLKYENIESIKATNRVYYEVDKIESTTVSMLLYKNADKIKITKNKIDKPLDRKLINDVMRRLISGAHFYFHGKLEKEIEANLGKIDKLITQYKKYSTDLRQPIDKIDDNVICRVVGSDISKEATLYRIYPLGTLSEKEAAIINAFIGYSLSHKYPSFYNIIRTSYGLSYQTVVNKYFINNNCYTIFSFGVSKENIEAASEAMSKAIDKSIREMRKEINEYIKEQKNFLSYLDNPIYKPMHCVLHYSAIRNKYDYINLDLLIDTLSSKEIIDFVQDRIYYGKFIEIQFIL